MVTDFIQHSAFKSCSLDSVNRIHTPSQKVCPLMANLDRHELTEIILKGICEMMIFPVASSLMDPMAASLNMLQLNMTKQKLPLNV